MSESRLPSREALPLDGPIDRELIECAKEMSIDERIGMVWELTVKAWSQIGVDITGMRMRRDVVRTIRPQDD